MIQSVGLIQYERLNQYSDQIHYSVLIQLVRWIGVIVLPGALEVRVL
jgi:hypothetical protein